MVASQSGKVGECKKINSKMRNEWRKFSPGVSLTAWKFASVRGRCIFWARSKDCYYTLPTLLPVHPSVLGGVSSHVRGRIIRKYGECRSQVFIS